MIEIIDKNIDEGTIDFKIHGKEITLTFMDGKQIEEELWQVEFARSMKKRKDKPKHNYCEVHNSYYGSECISCRRITSHDRNV